MLKEDLDFQEFYEKVTKKDKNGRLYKIKSNNN